MSDDLKTENPDVTLDDIERSRRGDGAEAVAMAYGTADILGGGASAVTSGVVRGLFERCEHVVDGKPCMRTRGHDHPTNILPERIHENEDGCTEFMGRVSKPSPDTKTPSLPLPYPDLPADHPANVDAIAKARVVTPLRLNLASGAVVVEGFEGVDMYADVQHKVNLFSFPWPWETSSVDELFCSHFIEHIPMAYTAPGRDCALAPRDEHDRDLWCMFMDEAWRVLKPDGKLTVIWPALQSVRAFQDPTHRRFIPMEQMQYLNPAFREANGLGHYLGACNFEIGHPTLTNYANVEEGRSQEAILGLVARCWNIQTDHKATLVAKK